MLGLAEYVTANADLKVLGKNSDAEIASQITDKTTKREALKIGQDTIRHYTTNRRVIVLDALRAISYNAVKYYEDALGTKVGFESEEVVNDLMRKKYYGITLAGRFKISDQVLQRRMILSSTINAVDKVYSQPVPYGAQILYDKRLMLGMAAKVENEVARRMAEDAEVPLIRWTLSGRHSRPDICDDLASAVNKDVVKYIEENDLKLNPKGLYFSKDLPEPPHPHCQCEYMMMTARGEAKRGVVKRTVRQIRQLISKLRRK